MKKWIFQVVCFVLFGVFSLSNVSAAVIVQSQVFYSPYGQSFQVGYVSDHAHNPINLKHNQLGYTGQYHEGGTGLLQLGGFRPYSPKIFRFIQVDTDTPFMKTSVNNAYAYVRGNPLAFEDLSGHDPHHEQDNPPPVPHYVYAIVAGAPIAAIVFWKLANYWAAKDRQAMVEEKPVSFDAPPEAGKPGESQGATGDQNAGGVNDERTPLLGGGEAREKGSYGASGSEKSPEPKKSRLFKKPKMTPEEVTTVTSAVENMTEQELIGYLGDDILYSPAIGSLKNQLVMDRVREMGWRRLPPSPADLEEEKLSWNWVGREGQPIIGKGVEHREESDRDGGTPFGITPIGSRGISSAARPSS